MKLKNQNLGQSVESEDFEALSPKCDALIKAQGTMQKGRKTCESQRWWTMSREQYLRTQQAWYIYGLTETVAPSGEPAQAQPDGVLAVGAGADTGAQSNYELICILYSLAKRKSGFSDGVLKTY